MQRPQAINAITLNDELSRFKRHISHLAAKGDHNGTDGDGKRQNFIFDSYLQVWSILCYTVKSWDELHIISTLTTRGTSDKLLPLDAPPFGWPGDQNSQAFIRNFLKNQWMFAPLTLTLDPGRIILKRDLARERILPIKEESEIQGPQHSSDYKSAVFKVTFHPCCLEVDGKHPHPETVIIKRIGPVPGSKEPKEWLNEVSVLTSFQEKPSDPDSDEDIITSNPFDYINRYLGSWHQGYGEDHGHGKSNRMWTIMLEYATLGDLKHFCAGNVEIIRKYGGEEKWAFWDGVLKDLFQGLECIHGFNWVHQDIKESNVVVDYQRPEAEAEPPSTFEQLRFKMIDFGKASRSGEPISGGNHGYMAPECCNTLDVHAIVLPKYNKESDIWSLGCMLSNLLITTQLGEEGHARYLAARKGESKGGPLQGTGFETGFYKNTSTRLQCVDSMHD
ncbi:kinase-like domain-containing protein, partial [Immersiella caudata]